MKFTELSDYRLPAGTVTEWAPYTVAAESEWVVDLRPVTFDHEAHLHRSAAYEAGNTWLGAVFEIDRPFDPAAFETALYLWTARHEVLRSTVSLDYFPGHRATDGITRRYTHPAGAIGIHGRVTGAMTGDAITAHLTSTFDSELSPLTWPHHRAVTITDLEPDSGGRDRFVVVLAADHCVVDAYSLLVAINELRTLYLAEFDGTDSQLACAGSHLDYGIHDRKAGAELTPVHPAVTHWRSFLAASGWRFPSFGPASARRRLEVPGAAGTPGPAGGSEFVLSAAEADEVNRICRAAGHSMQTTVMTALALAHRAVTGEPRMRAAMPMHTRCEPRFVDAIGWFVGLGPLDVDLSSAETFCEAMDLAVTAIGAAKALSRYPYPRITQLTGCDAIPEFVISYLDVRYVRGAADWSRLRAQTLRGGSESDREVYLWVARTPDGITVSTRHPRGGAAMAAVRDFIDTAVAIISRVGSEGVNVPLDRVAADQLPA